jgi:hypothetical protein
MRSLIIVPADEKRLVEALASGADAVIVDLASAPAESMRAPAAAGRRSPSASTRSIRARPTPTSTRS